MYIIIRNKSYKITVTRKTLLQKSNEWLSKFIDNRQRITQERQQCTVFVWWQPSDLMKALTPRDTYSLNMRTVKIL